MAYSQPVRGQTVPGPVEPHGYSRCWLPPAAAYSHSASLGKNPPSQMQNAYAAYQFTQLMGRFSCDPGEVVHVVGLSSASGTQVTARSSVDSMMFASSEATQPDS